MLRTITKLVCACVFALFMTGASLAEETVDVALVLAVDESGSISEYSWMLQTRGYADAFRDGRVLKAIMSGPNQRIAVTMMYWSGPVQQRIAVPWTVIHDQKSANDLADEIMRIQRVFWGGTAVGAAIQYATRLLADMPFQAVRRVIDISGDGANNKGPASSKMRDEALQQGITINGLPIIWADAGVYSHYRTEVIGGPGAFLIAASSFEDFAEAIRNKLILEIS